MIGNFFVSTVFWNGSSNFSKKLPTYFYFFPRLQSGWSVKTAIMNQWKQPQPISADEHEAIRLVVEKAEAMEKAEEERLG